MTTQNDGTCFSAETNATTYEPPVVHTITLATLWRRLGPAVAVTNSPNMFDSLVPSDPADGLFDE